MGEIAMRPNCFICEIFIDEVLGSLDHVPDQILSLLLAQFAEALQALGIIFNLLCEPLAHRHAQLVGIQGRGFGPPAQPLSLTCSWSCLHVLLSL